MQIKTFKYLLYPTPHQKESLDQIIEVCRNWYNLCLSERKLAWEIEKRNISKHDQMKISIRYRRSIPLAKVVCAQSLQNVCNDLDKAFKAFFRRIKAKETAGYPRFKGKNQFRSFNFPHYGNGIKIDGRRLRIFNVGRVAVRWDHRLTGRIKIVRIIRSADRYYAAFTCEVEDEAKLARTGNRIGIDLNIENLLTDSNGKRIENPKYYYKTQRKLRLAQRSVQRKKKHSINRKKAIIRIQKLHEHIKNQREDLLKKTVHEYIQNNDVIVLEELQINNMTRNHHLSKSILDSGWGYLKKQFLAKGENTGREIILVKPHNTSKTCSQCGKLLENIDLSVRWIDCSCGLSKSRDHNAAINILNRGIIGWGPSVEHNVDNSPACSRTLTQNV